MVVDVLSVRLQLNKKIQQLEKFLHDVERQNSNYSASTTTQAFQYETPQASVLRTNYMNSDAQVHSYYESGRYDNGNLSSVSFSSVDRFGVPSYPVEREPYIPKIIDVNYIEGSNDPKWSNVDFPWTKELEVGM